MRDGRKTNPKMGIARSKYHVASYPNPRISTSTDTNLVYVSKQMMSYLGEIAFQPQVKKISQQGMKLELKNDKSYKNQHKKTRQALQDKLPLAFNFLCTQ